MTCTCAGALTTEGPGVITPHSNFQTKQGPTVSVSNVRDIAFGCSEIIRTRSFTIFTGYATIFRQLTHVFSNYKRELYHFTLDLLKKSDT